METLVIYSVIVFAITAITYVELLMYKKPLSEKQIADYQKLLDENCKRTQEKYGLELKYDAKTQLLEERKMTKVSVIIFSGILIALVFVLLLVLTRLITPALVGVMCISAITLICYGMIKMAESKKLAAVILAAIFIFGISTKLFFDSWPYAPYGYYYLCLIIIILGAAVCLPKAKFKK